MIQITVQQEALSLSKVRWILGQVLLLIGLWMLMEISLHYFYTTALQQVRVVLVILAEAIIWFDIKYFYPKIYLHEEFTTDS